MYLQIICVYITYPYSFLRHSEGEITESTAQCLNRECQLVTGVSTRHRAFVLQGRSAEYFMVETRLVEEVRYLHHVKTITRRINWDMGTFKTIILVDRNKAY